MKVPSATKEAYLLMTQNFGKLMMNFRMAYYWANEDKELGHVAF